MTTNDARLWTKSNANPTIVYAITFIEICVEIRGHMIVKKMYFFYSNTSSVSLINKKTFEFVLENNEIECICYQAHVKVVLCVNYSSTA